MPRLARRRPSGITEAENFGSRRRSCVIGPLWPRPKEEGAMQTKNDASKRAYSRIDRSLGIIAAAAFLWPAVAVAGQWNPTASDSNSNTAAGTSALETHGSGGYANTAMGKEALFHNNGGGYNTASGIDALFVNTTG